VENLKRASLGGYDERRKRESPFQRGGWGGSALPKTVFKGNEVGGGEKKESKIKKLRLGGW